MTDEEVFPGLNSSYVPEYEVAEVVCCTATALKDPMSDLQWKGCALPETADDDDVGRLRMEVAEERALAALNLRLSYQKSSVFLLSDAPHRRSDEIYDDSHNRLVIIHNRSIL